MNFEKFQRNLGKIFRKDIQSALFSNKIVVLGLIVIIIVPSLYSLLNIDACWDPYGNTDDLKFAVVNNDLGSVYEGENLNFGNELVDNLKNNTKFDWRFVSEENANRGIENGTYHAAIIIPADFTEKILSITTDTPQQAELKYIVNGKTNPVTGRMGDSAQKTLTKEINSEIVKIIDTVAFEKLGILQSGLASGAGQLSSGANQLNSGASQISSASDQISYGAQQIEIAAGIIEKIYGNNSASELARQSSKLAGSSSQLASSSSNLATSSGSALASAASALGTASGSLSAVNLATEDAVSDYIQSPVVVNKTTINEVETYGSEVTPFYLVLSIWVGCIISCAMLKTRYKNDEYKGEKFSPLEMYFGKMNLFLIIAFLQTTVTTIGSFLIGFKIDNPLLFVFSMYFITLVLLTLIYSIISVFGNVGKAVALILLVLQIFSTGGVFPVELMAKWCQVLNPYMPMTYAIKMLREVCLGVYWPNYLYAFLILVGLYFATIIIAVLIKEKYNDRANYFEEQLQSSDLFQL